MYGVIDIGSNTIRLSCYEVTDTLHYVFHKKSMAGLASYVREDGQLSEKGEKRLLEVLLAMKETVESLVLKDLFVFATASLRNIVNTDAVLQHARETVGWDIQVITGEEEARLDFLGAMGKKDIASGMLADIGGGSTELVAYREKKIVRAVSIPAGSLNLYTHYVKDILPREKELREIKRAVKKELEQLGEWEESCPQMIGVGGTCRAVCKLYNERYGEAAGNKRMEAEKLRQMRRLFLENPKREARTILQVVPDRIHTILPGLTALTTIVRWYGIEEIHVSDWGVREGYLLARLQI